MSKKGSNGEAILSIYLKDFYKGWKELLDFELSNIVLEQRHANSNIDLSAVNRIRKLGVYVEIQLTKANTNYLDRIQNMMNRYPESVIIWVARSFDKMLLQELEDWMAKHNKQYIDFYALTISDEALKELHSLNKLYKLDVYHKMRVLNDIDNLLQVEYKLINLHPMHCGSVAIEPPTYDFSRPDDVKKALLKVLQKRMPYYLNFHYRKKRTSTITCLQLDLVEATSLIAVRQIMQIHWHLLSCISIHQEKKNMLHLSRWKKLFDKKYTLKLGLKFGK